MAEDTNALDRLSEAGNEAIDLINRVDTATGKFQPGKRQGSIIKAAQKNIFEFPVFISNSIPLDFATATVSLLEQNYAAYLQMAISINPVVDAKTVKNGLQFAQYKVNTNKYIEYTDPGFQHDVCHNIIQEGNNKFEFDLLSIEDREARIINEAVDHQPLSEFSHFFQEAELDPNLNSRLMAYYPMPDFYQDNNGRWNLANDSYDVNGQDFYFNTIKFDDLKFVTIDEIHRFCLDNHIDSALCDDAIANLNNTMRYYHIQPETVETIMAQLNRESIDSNRIINDTISTFKNRLNGVSQDAYSKDSELQTAIENMNRQIPGFKTQMDAYVAQNERILKQAADDAIKQQMDVIKFKTSNNLALNTTEKDLLELTPHQIKELKDSNRAELASIVARANSDTITAAYNMAKAGKNYNELPERMKNAGLSEAQYNQLAGLAKTEKDYNDARNIGQNISNAKNLFSDIESRIQAGYTLKELPENCQDLFKNADGTLNEDLFNRIKNSVTSQQRASAAQTRSTNFNYAINKLSNGFDLTDNEANELNIDKNSEEYQALKAHAQALRARDEAQSRILQRQAQKADSKYYRTADALQTGLNVANTAASTVNAATNAAYNIATFRDRKQAQKTQTQNLELQQEKLKQDIERGKRDLEDYDKMQALKKTEVLAKTKTSNIQYVDDAKCNKMNTMKPLLMKVTLSMLNKDDSIQPIEYVIGVKTHNRVIPASILPEVAKYPLKEMDKISRKIKWRAGELKFLKDLVFRIDEKKQTAADSRDPNRKWYRRLYELAHMKGDAPSTAVVQGKSIFGAFIRDKQGKSKLMHGFIPNAAIVMSQADVNNIKQQTEIDLLKGSSAKKFCGELFLMNLVVIDTDAGSIKIMQPDEANDYSVYSLASVNKQLATLDTAGTKTRDMFKLLG